MDTCLACTKPAPRNGSQDELVSERVILARLRAQDPTVLAVFYRQYKAPVLSIARRMVSDEWDAEEVLQDVVWTVSRKIHTFRGDTDFKHWLYRVTQNAARMLLRKKKRAPIPCEDGDMEVLLNNSMDHQRVIHPEQLVIQRRAVEKMEKEVEQFDPINRALFSSMEVDGVSKEVVAERLGLSVPAVKARLHRIRKALRSSVEELLPAA